MGWQRGEELVLADVGCMVEAGLISQSLGDKPKAGPGSRGTNPQLFVPPCMWSGPNP